ncbi:MAG: excinuclease ABC subunit UvrC [Oscillospiraceae bacterium]|nr:excinuclease ABC subunit UvrC [Oscillospiraceae bacterium]
MTHAELKEKALSLPYSPGVYIMQNKAGQVIYVGKAKKLKNRVSQYFQDSSAHTGKTRRMVSQIDHFDTIVVQSEFEALILENSLIKRHMPRYNILLKDDKGYPYVRIDRSKPYPVMELAGKTAADGAEYFGPYGGRFITQKLIDAIRLTLKLPGCSREFPRDIGKGRPCLNHHLGNCDAWCRGVLTQTDYNARIDQAISLLRGKYSAVADEIRANMTQAAEELRFEEAASLRDRLRAIESLKQKQFVTAGHSTLTDAVGYFENESNACFAVLHFSDGTLVDKDYQVFSAPGDPAEAVSALVKQYYLSRGSAPKKLLLPMEMEDTEPFSQLLAETYGRRTEILVPQRGEGVRLVTLACENAREEADRITTKDERHSGKVRLLQQTLGMEQPPRRIESYDISNTAGKDIVASMVVFVDGKPSKKDYKHFQIRDLTDQDDYTSMRQVLNRRFTHALAGDAGFSEMPDLLLIDGGIAHANCAVEELTTLGISLPTYGMVKDDRHRTRALVTPEGKEIGISTQPALFSLIGAIQEETHRFAITYHRKKRAAHLRKSQLENIPGIGPKRRQELLKRFRSIAAIRAADIVELQAVLPEKQAKDVYAYFHRETEQ